MRYHTPTECMTWWLSTSGSDYMYDSQVVVVSEEPEDFREYFSEVHNYNIDLRRTLSEDEFLDIDWTQVSEFIVDRI